MRIEVGQRYFNRAGAVVEIIKRERTGYQKRHPVTWDPIGPIDILFIRIIHFANGRKAPPASGLQYALHEDGCYLPIGEHELDLVKEVENVRSAVSA
jgi:hypothetical protein